MVIWPGMLSVHGEERLERALRADGPRGYGNVVSGPALAGRTIRFSLRRPGPWTWAMVNSRERLHDRVLHRKEVIQPQVPLRLPCYDFIPVTSLTLGRYLLAVGARTSGATGFHDVTGGVYKTRERIHGAVADAPLLAIPASWRRIAASNPN